MFLPEHGLCVLSFHSCKAAAFLGLSQLTSVYMQYTFPKESLPKMMPRVQTACFVNDSCDGKQETIADDGW